MRQEANSQGRYVPFRAWLAGSSARRSILLGLLMLSQPSPATAAPKAGEITSVDSIRQLMEKGQSLFVAGEYTMSAEIFEAGYELHPYSAFLFNAGVAFEKADRLEDALARFKKYTTVDAAAPDRAEVQKRIVRIEQEIADRKLAEKSGKKSKATAVSTEESATKSLVVVETEPPGATVHFFRKIAGDSPYQLGSDNPGYISILSGISPTNASLDVGTYHILVDRFGNFNPSESDLEVVSGHVHQLKLNLSQGAFMAYLRVSANPKRAQVFLDDPNRERTSWGTVPHGELVQVGKHVVVVAAPGYVPVQRDLTLAEGQKEHLALDLVRVNFGTIRIDSNAPQIQVLLDGRPVGSWTAGKPPLEIEGISAGPHQITVTAPDRKPVVDTLYVPRGQVQLVRANMVVRPPRGAAWTEAVISGVLLGGGVYLGLESNHIYDALGADRNSGNLVRDDSRGTRGKIYAISADIAFLGSAVLGGLATYSFLKDPLPPSRLITGKIREFDGNARTLSPGGTP